MVVQHAQCGNYGNLLSLFFWQKFRESNVYIYTSINKYLIDLTKLFSVRVNFCNFQFTVHTVEIAQKHSHAAIFPWNHF